MAALPVGQPYIVVDSPYRVVQGEAAKPKTRARVSVGTVIGRMVLFGLFCWVGYLVSGLAGQVLLEKARNQVIEAEKRASAALKLQATEQARIDALMDLREVRRWAKGNGFVAPDRIVEPSVTSDLVARHDAHL